MKSCLESWFPGAFQGGWLGLHRKSAEKDLRGSGGGSRRRIQMLPLPQARMAVKEEMWLDGGRWEGS